MIQKTQLLEKISQTRNVVLGEITKAVCENRGYINLHNVTVGFLGFDPQTDKESLEPVKAFCLSAMPSNGSILLKYIDGDEEDKIQSCSLDLLSLNELYDIVKIMET